MTYNKAGNKLTETNAKNDTMTYAYDKLNRVSTITVAYSKVISSKEYDENGNVIKDIDAEATSQAIVMQQGMELNTPITLPTSL